MLEFLEGGFQTTVQDYPGRVGYWKIGIPPSGPMDPLAFRLANMLVDNPPGEAGFAGHDQASIEAVARGTALENRRPQDPVDLSMPLV